MTILPIFLRVKVGCLNDRLDGERKVARKRYAAARGLFLKFSVNRGRGGCSLEVVRAPHTAQENRTVRGAEAVGAALEGVVRAGERTRRIL